MSDDFDQMERLAAGATTTVGLSPLEAILTNEGPGQAKFFGWRPALPRLHRHQREA